MTSNASAGLYRERLASLLPVINAFIAGKHIQWRSNDRYPWVDYVGDYPNFFRITAFGASSPNSAKYGYIAATLTPYGWTLRRGKLAQTSELCFIVQTLMRAICHVPRGCP